MIQKILRVGFVALAMAGAGSVGAQTYPNKSVRIVVPFAPGEVRMARHGRLLSVCRPFWGNPL